jgi:hypothetical protein
MEGNMKTEAKTALFTVVALAFASQASSARAAGAQGGGSDCGCRAAGASGGPGLAQLLLALVRG